MQWGLKKGELWVGGWALQLADNEVVLTPAPLSAAQHFTVPLCVCPKLHNVSVIRGRGLRLCTHAVFCGLKFL